MKASKLIERLMSLSVVGNCDPEMFIIDLNGDEIELDTVLFDSEHKEATLTNSVYSEKFA